MMMGWDYIIVIVCLLLAGFFAWQEYKRAAIANRLWRIIAVIIAAAALACIALPIRYNTGKNGPSATQTILLTAGFDTDSLKGEPNATLLTFDKDIKKLHPKARLLNSLDEIGTTQQLHVYGYGLKPDELQQLNGLPLSFHPSVIPAGISNISWNDRLKAGEELHVQGWYNNPFAKKIKLVLKGLNTELANITIGPGAQTFNLSTKPKTTGKVVYSLQSVVDGDTLTAGSLPLQIETVKPLKILMLSASPDFETRFLKNWLSENGYAIALRSAISKGKFNNEYINIGQLPPGRLSAPALNKFDVVLGDLSVLNTLTATESAALKQEVADKGLGLIIRADSAGKSSWLQRYFPVDKPSGKAPAPAAIIINGKKSNSTNLGTGTAQIIYKDGTRPLIKSAQGCILASSILWGEGKMVFTTLNTTFSWMLAGDKTDYTALWSAIISTAARKAAEAKRTLEASSLPFVNEPVSLSIWQGEPSPIFINNQQVAAAQNPGVPFEWQVTYRPQAAGWQEWKQGDETLYWYAYNPHDWPGVQATEKLSATKKYAAAHPANAIVTKQIQQKVQIAVPKIYFYILLLAACTFLWIETKFS
jgi:hypothetical protein